MHVVFIRHASAEASADGGDAKRPLTKHGKGEANATARAIKRLGVRLDIVISSPLVRAVQTAEIVAKVHKGAAVVADDSLAPPADAVAVARRLRELQQEGVSAVALVGHLPSLDECLARVAAGVHSIGTSFSKAGAACVVLGADAANGKAELLWYLHRKHLAMLAAAD